MTKIITNNLRKFCRELRSDLNAFERFMKKEQKRDKEMPKKRPQFDWDEVFDAFLVSRREERNRR